MLSFGVYNARFSSIKQILKRFLLTELTGILSDKSVQIILIINFGKKLKLFINFYWFIINFFPVWVTFFGVLYDIWI